MPISLYQKKKKMPISPSNIKFKLSFMVAIQVIYTVGRDPHYQRTIVAEKSPLFTAPVIVSIFIIGHHLINCPQ